MNGHQPVIPRDGRHVYALRVYYEDTDAGGVVYHAGYLRFAERARTEALREMGIPHAEMTERFGLMFVVRRVEVDYLRAARLDDSLEVETMALEVGGASVLLRQDVRHRGVSGPEGLCARLDVRLACVRIGDAARQAVAAGDRESDRQGPARTNPGGNKPGRIPPQWRTALAAMREAGQANRVAKGIV